MFRENSLSISLNELDWTFYRVRTEVASSDSSYRVDWKKFEETNQIEKGRIREKEENSCYSASEKTVRLGKVAEPFHP